MTPFIIPSDLSAALPIANTHCYANNFDVDVYANDLFEHYKITCPNNINNAVVKRKAEFLCGRYTAQQALYSLGLGKQEIAIGANRAPIFPEGVIGSISHTGNTAISIVALDTRAQYLGIDIESIISLDLFHKLHKQIISPDEKHLLKQSDLSTETAFTVTYSAKESVFKALHPSVGKYFDFHAARLNKICTRTQKVELELTEDLAPSFTSGTIVSGEFYLDETLALTVIHKNHV